MATGGTIPSRVRSVRSHPESITHRARPLLAGAALVAAAGPTLAEAPPFLRMSHFGADGGMEPPLAVRTGPGSDPLIGAFVAAVLVGVLAVAITTALWLRARRALAAAEARFHQLAEQGSDVVMRLRGKMREASTSVFDLLGYTADEMSALDWATLIHPDDLARVWEARRSIPDRASRAIAYRLIHKDGRTIFVEAVVCRIDAGGEPELIVTLRDVTARHEENDGLRRAIEAARVAEAAAAEASRAKGDFLASMSHEIRTPLNAIIGFADLISVDRSLSSTARQHAERVKAGGAALLTVVNDILDFSQIEAGALRLDPRPFALPLLIDECVALVETAALARNLALRVDLDARVPAGVVGDETRLRQVLLNLVNNAIKFTHAGSVTLRIRRDEAGRILFEIEDTGIGIAEADMPNLFERFRQVDGTIRRTYGGTGLGLAISKMLVEAMGGAIGVRSEPVTGSTFWFSLDLPTTRLTLEAAQEKQPAIRTRPLAILLAEDVRLNQELVLAVLEALGHRVDVVDDGAEAIMAADHGRYDLVLMDLQMPHVDGMTATRAIRRLPHAGRLVPIVALSANVLPAQVEAALASGMDDFVAKPLTLETVGALMERVGRGDLRTDADAAAHEAEVLAKLAAIVGEAKVRSMLATLEGALVSRFEPPLAPETVPALKAEAHAAIAGSAMLGFKPFSALCRRFIEAENEADLARLHDDLLRELGRVVRIAGTMARGGDVSGRRAA